MAFEAVVTQCNNTFITTCTATLNAGTNADRVVLVLASSEYGGGVGESPTSATYGGVSMTAGTEFTVAGIKTRLFWLVGAASGSNSVVVTYAAATLRHCLIAVAYSGYAAASGETTSVTGGNAVSLAIPSSNGSLGVGLGFSDAGGGNTATPASGETERLDADLSPALYHAYVYEEASTGSSVTVGWVTAAGSNPISGGVSLAPAAPASSGDLAGAVTLDGPTVSGGLTSNPPSTLSGTVTLDDAAAGGTLGVQPGRVLSEPLKTNQGVLQANVALSYYALYNDVTGALVLRKTGISTNASGIVDFTDPAVQTGVIYKHDWETVTGERRMPRKAAA